MLQTFNLDGTGRQIDIAARFFRYESGDAGGQALEIRVNADGQDLGTYLPGDAVRLPAGVPEATRWVFTPVSSALAATVRLGRAEVESARLVGSVNVIDGNARKTQSGNQFYATLTKAAIAGKVSLVGLQAVTKSLAVKRLALYSAAGGNCGVWQATGAPTDVPSSATLLNKLNITAGSDGRRVSGEATTTTPSGVELPGGSRMFFSLLAPGVWFELPLTTPIVLTPGRLLIVAGAAVNVDLTYNADCEEL